MVNSKGDSNLIQVLLISFRVEKKFNEKSNAENANGCEVHISGHQSPWRTYIRI